jgi:hypothetical protein
VSALTTALGVAVAMLSTALVLLGVVLVRLSRDTREARQETAMAWAMRDDWTEHARLLQNRLDAVDQHYAMTPSYRPWVAGARHRADDTVILSRVEEAT